MWRKIKARVWAEARRVLGRYPTIYFSLGAFRGRSFRDRKVTKETDIVIDGYPRSANSFAVGAFRRAQSGEVNVAHHLHVPAQILRASELGIPTILLVRHPVEAIISYRALHREGEIVEEEPRDALRMSFRPFFRTWIDFYDKTLQCADSLIVGLFNQVIEDYGVVLGRVNKMYRTQFSLFDHTEKNEKEVNEKRGYHSGPSSRRRELKKEVRERFQDFRRKNREIVEKADRLYEVYERKAVDPTI